MQLKKIEFKELEGDKREWTVAPASFGQINLIVGKNASGKTRLLNIMVSLGRLISGKIKPLFASIDYKVNLVAANGQNFFYEISVRDRLVRRECLNSENEQYLVRDGFGPGKIRTTQKGELTEFQIKPDQAAIFSKRDSLQYPFLEEIVTWAEDTEHYEFADLFGPDAIGNSAIMMRIDQTQSPEKILRRGFGQGDSIQLLIQAGISKFGDEFKRSIIADMKQIGYDLQDIGIGVLSSIQINPPPIGIWVKEADLKCNTEQTTMSLGMFRALCAVIRMNLMQFTNAPSSIFLDDVGEGLDFERSVGLIKTLIEKTEKGRFQLFMTTNDRFVMNEVPLKYWNVIIRTGSSIKLKNYENSKDEFEKFEKLGLNNFDYFVANSG